MQVVPTVLFCLMVIFFTTGCHKEDFDWAAIHEISCDSSDVWRGVGLQGMMDKGLNENELVDFFGCLTREIDQNTWNGSRLPFHTWITRNEFEECHKHSALSKMTFDAADEQFILAYAMCV